MIHSVVAALAPVVLLIAIGFIAARAHLIRATAAKDLSNLVFMVLSPALLFRTMSTVHIEQVRFAPVLVYLAASLLIFFTVWQLGRSSRRAAVLAMACTYSNLVMIGIPLIGLAYGEPGLVTLFTLIAVHALVLLTTATIALEWSLANEPTDRLSPAPLGSACETSAASGSDTRADTGCDASSDAYMSQPVASAHAPHWLRITLQAARNTLIHPVPLPILLGLLFALTGRQLPALIDKPLQLLGSAFGPMALLLVGVTLAGSRVGAQWRPALGLALTKNLLMPALVLALGLVASFIAQRLGLGAADGLAGLGSIAGGSISLQLTVMVVAAAMPMGANVFLFSQRYSVAQELTTASMAMSSLLALVTVTLVMAAVQWLS